VFSNVAPMPPLLITGPSLGTACEERVLHFCPQCLCRGE